MFTRYAPIIDSTNASIKFLCGDDHDYNYPFLSNVISIKFSSFQKYLSGIRFDCIVSALLLI